MFQLRFNHVFLGLMLLSGLSAFVIPQKYSDRVRNIQGVFAPVARPISALAGWAHGRIAPEKVSDKRQDEDIRRENDELRVALASVEGQLEALRKLNSDRELLGRIR